MFGIDNTGVINQRQSPAIWQSDLGDFPPNFILGRILIDNVYGGIYLDTSSTRIQIQSANSGSLTFVNGIESIATTPTSTEVTLGGSLINDTIIDITPNTLEFAGINTSAILQTSGYILDGASGNYYPNIDVKNIDVIVPNKLLEFFNPKNNVSYQVLALEL